MVVVRDDGMGNNNGPGQPQKNYGNIFKILSQAPDHIISTHGKYKQNQTNRNDSLFIKLNHLSMKDLHNILVAN
jgi:hypothetical protein